MSGILSSLRITGGKLSDQKFLFLGAGEASMGIGGMLTALMVEQGLDEAEARKRCWFMDTKGLIVEGRERINEHKAPYAHPPRADRGFS